MLSVSKPRYSWACSLYARKKMPFWTAALYLTGFIVAVILGSPFVETVLKRVDADPDAQFASRDKVWKQSRLIGMAERTLVFLIVSAYGADGVQAAALFFAGKTIPGGNRGFYLLGTLLSFAWATFWAILIRRIAR